MLSGKEGKFLSVEDAGGKIYGGKWLRVRILGGVTKLLKQGCWLTLATEDRRGSRSNGKEFQIFALFVVVLIILRIIVKS